MPRILVCIIASLIIIGLAGPSPASTPAGTSKPAQAQINEIEVARGGDTDGYGFAAAYTVNHTTQTIDLTTVSSDGVYTIHFANIGAYAVFGTLDGTSPTTGAGHFYVPAGYTFTSRTKSPASSVKAQTATTDTTTTLVIAW